MSLTQFTKLLNIYQKNILHRNDLSISITTHIDLYIRSINAD